MVTDHKHLCKVLGDKDMDDISNSRIFKFKESILPYDFNLIHVPGESPAMKTVDALSRHPQTGTGPFDKVMESTKAFALSQGDGIESVTWDTVNTAAANDPECLGLVQLILDGFPDDKSSLPPIL